MRALDAFESLIALWRAARDTTLEASRAGDRQRATAIVLVRSESVARAVKTKADAVLAKLVEAVAAGAKQSLASSRATERLMLLSLLAGAGIAVVLSVLAARTISRPLREAVDVLTGVGRGDFTRRLNIDSRDEVGQLSRSLNDTLTALRDAFAGLRHRAFHDNLTGLANRALLRDLLAAAVSGAHEGTQMAVLLIDLDGFKKVNDRYGHAVGDELLMTVAHRVQGAIRDRDTAARLGGDEFAVLLEQIESASDARLAADRILVDIEAPLRLDGIELLPRASIGLALWNGHTSTDALLHEADVAMYAAKAAGKSTVIQFDHLKFDRRERTEASA